MVVNLRYSFFKVQIKISYAVFLLLSVFSLFWYNYTFFLLKPFYGVNFRHRIKTNVSEWCKPMLFTKLTERKFYLLSFLNFCGLKLIGSLCFSPNDLLTFDNQQACLLVERDKGGEPSCVYFSCGFPQRLASLWQLASRKRQILLVWNRFPRIAPRNNPPAFDN